MFGLMDPQQQSQFHLSDDDWQKMFPFLKGGMQQPFSFTGVQKPASLAPSSPSGGMGGGGSPAMGAMGGMANLLSQSGVLGHPASGALSGLTSGAAMGSFGGPVGAGIGAAIGGTLGLLGGKGGQKKQAAPAPQLPQNYSQQWYGGGGF